MNDPTCKLRNNPAHTCHDKFGQRWDRGDVGPREGTRCAVAIEVERAAAQLQAELESDAMRDVLHADRQDRMEALGDLFASVMPDPDDEDRCEAGLEDYR